MKEVKTIPIPMTQEMLVQVDRLLETGLWGDSAVETVRRLLEQQLRHLARERHA